MRPYPGCALLLPPIPRTPATRLASGIRIGTLRDGKERSETSRSIVSNIREAEEEKDCVCICGDFCRRVQLGRLGGAWSGGEGL